MSIVTSSREGGLQEATREWTTKKIEIYIGVSGFFPKGKSKSFP